VMQLRFASVTGSMACLLDELRLACTQEA